MLTNRLSIRELGTTSFVSPVRFAHEGDSGGAEIKCYRIQSISEQHAYTNVTIAIEKLNGAVVDAADAFTDDGWTIKLYPKTNSSFPTEEEWGKTIPNTTAMLNDIGDIDDVSGIATRADKNTVQYVFVRVFCPGHTRPGAYAHELTLTYNSILIANGEA